MTADTPHIRSDQYVQTRMGRQSPATLALLLHQHLVAVCPDCRREWEQLARDRGRLRGLLIEALEAPGLPKGDEPDHHLPGESPQARREEAEVQQLRELRREARKQTWELLQFPPEERVGVIDSANTRFRSRAVAEYLIERCRVVIRDEPGEAAEIALLVHRVLQWCPGAGGTLWAAALEARATAWHANALRVAGELPSADRVFAKLRRDLAASPLDDPGALGEIRSLEASLRIAQRQHDEARLLLDEAGLLFQTAADPNGLLRTTLQHGNLLLTLGQSQESLLVFEAADGALTCGHAEPFLRFSALNGRVAALCDLDRHSDAQDLLDQNLDLYESVDGPYAGSILRALQGRIALGNGDLAAAEDHLRTASEGLMQVGRHLDAALVALDLAEVLLLAGRSADLRDLAAQLLPSFRSRRVAREDLTVIQLLAKAVAAEGLSKEVLDQLRARLQRHTPYLVPLA